MFPFLKKRPPISEHLLKRAREIRQAAEISGRMGFFKELARYTDWMPDPYKEDLIKILKWVEENGDKQKVRK